MVLVGSQPPVISKTLKPCHPESQPCHDESKSFLPLLKMLPFVIPFLLIAAECRAQAFVESVSPPVFRRGSTQRAEFIGTEVNNAIGIWTSLSDGSIKTSPVEQADAGKSVLNIEVADNAPLGIFGLRLATKSGLSNVHLFAIDELPIVLRDPAIAGSASMPISLPVSVVANCRPSAVDRYSIVVEKDQRVAFEVIGNRFGKDYDPLVQIRNSAGRIVAECDHSVGLLFDCRFSHRFAEAGTYTVDVRDSRFDGHPTWNYVLRIGDFPDARTSVPSAVRIAEPIALTFPQMPGWQLPLPPRPDKFVGDFYQEIRQSPSSAAAWIPLTTTNLPVACEVEPNDAKETATSVTVPGTLNGVLWHPGDRDWFAFELKKDQKLTFQGVSQTIGSAADLELLLFDVDGREVRKVDDIEFDEGGFAFTAGKDGVHWLQVRELSRDGGPEFAYRIDVENGTPRFQLLADVPDITLSKGGYQPLPVKITRTDFPGEIQLELQGAPPGISLQPVSVPENATEVNLRIFASADSPEGVFTLELIGTATSQGETIRAIAKTKPLVDRQLKNVDLIPYALRDDQRLLPPSLLDKISLMVTPAVPFTVELPESVVLLPRFQTAEFPITTTRAAGFSAPITFTVKGGQIGDERDERNQVYARFLPATTERLSTSGIFHNRINTQLNKYRVDLTASADVDGKRLNLVRSFSLDVRSAFQPTCEPAVVNVKPGESAKVKISANRVPTFDGPVTITLGPQFGFLVPASVEIPAGQPSVECEIKVEPTLNPGRHQIRIEAAGYVGKFEESLNLPGLQIEVMKQ